MNKQFRTLSGVQYSGIELFLLPAVNNRNDILCTTTSVCDAMENMYDVIISAISENNEADIINENILIPRLFQSLFQIWYQEATQPYIFLINEDIARHLWPLQTFIDPNIKHIFFYRSLPELVQCHVKQIEKDPGHSINVSLFKNGKEQTRENRARAVVKTLDQFFHPSFEACRDNFELNKDFFILDYKNIRDLSWSNLSALVFSSLGVELDSPSPQNNSIPIKLDDDINNIEPNYFSNEIIEFIAEHDKIGKHL